MRRYYLYPSGSFVSNIKNTGSFYNIFGSNNLPLSSSIQAVAGNNAPYTISFFSPPNNPNIHGYSGSYTASLYISTANANTSMSVRLHRVNQYGVIQQSTTSSLSQMLTAIGAYRYFFGPTGSLSSFAANDRIRVDFQMYHNMAFSPSFVCGSTGSYLESPTSARIIGS
jgi:hypothetical protein